MKEFTSVVIMSSSDKQKIVNNFVNYGVFWYVLDKLDLIDQNLVQSHMDDIYGLKNIFSSKFVHSSQLISRKTQNKPKCLLSINEIVNRTINGCRNALGNLG